MVFQQFFIVHAFTLHVGLIISSFRIFPNLRPKKKQKGRPFCHGFLDFNFHFVVAGGAHHIPLAPELPHPEVVLANGTRDDEVILVRLRFGFGFRARSLGLFDPRDALMPEPPSDPGKPFGKEPFHGIPSAEEPLVFPPAGGKIPGENPKQGVKKNQVFDDHQSDPINEPVHSPDKEEQHEESPAKGIVPVSSR
jgi:hypothetical protein